MASTIINVQIITIPHSADIALTIIPASVNPDPKKLPTPMDMSSTAQKTIIPNTIYPKYFILPPNFTHIVTTAK